MNENGGHNHHDHESMLIRRAHALRELAERHYHPDTRHIGKEDYDLMMEVVNDLHNADAMLERLYDFAQMMSVLSPARPVVLTVDQLPNFMEGRN